MRQDRFLIAILAAIAILVLAALGLFFVRQGSRTYLPEDRPEAVVSNYVLALEMEDYRRAYSYLEDGAGKPTFEAFRQAILLREVDTGRAALQIGEAHTEDGEAVVELTVIHTGSGPFADVYREPASALLVIDESGQWKIAMLPNPFWSWSWYTRPPAKPQ